MVNTNTALNTILSNVLSHLQTTYTYFAIGSGTTTETSTDVALESEAFRDTIDEVQVGPNYVLYRCYVGTTEANGISITEFAIFDSDTGGNMLLRKAFPAINKTSDMDIWFEVQETVSVS